MGLFLCRHFTKNLISPFQVIYMKLHFSFLSLFLFLVSICISQNSEFDSLLNAGKQEFEKSFEDQNYANAVKALEKATELQPENAEAHYFLGYAYSRFNAKDGSSIPEMKRKNSEACSREFEKVNELTPKYEGPMVVLDPYTKISSEWGSLAMSYYYRDELDSAKWAFEQGKERGGFSSYSLDFAKSVLDLCSENSILMSSGDLYTINFWYLQIKEEYRTDVSVVDISLLNTIWYPNMLQKKGLMDFGMSTSEMEEIAHSKWSDSLIRIDHLTWIMKPSYQDEYILRADRLFLELLKVNEFKRDVYLTTSIRDAGKLSLQDHLTPWIMMERIDMERREMDEKTYKKNISKLLSLSKKANMNSDGDLFIIDLVRYTALNRSLELIEVGQKIDAQEMVDIVEKYTPSEKYPYQNDNTAMLLQSLKDQLDEN